MNTISYGVARRVINPEMPISLAGYFNERLWDHVKDDVQVRALILRDRAGKFAAVIQFDLVTVTYTLYSALFEQLAAAGITDVVPENSIVTATHSHTAPELRAADSGSYIDFAAGKAVEAVRDALNSLQEGELFAGLTADARFIFNRRFWMKNGTVVTNPGKLNPDIVRPEGEIDPEIPILAIKRDGRYEVVLANIVNHTDTIGGCGVSADWAGFTIRTLQEKLGADTLVMPLIGAAGNINHFDVASDFDQTCYAEAERVGCGYAETIGKALENLRPVQCDRLVTRFTAVTILPREIDPEEIAEAEEIIAKYPEISIGAASANDLTSEDLAKKTPFALKYFAQKLLDMAGNTAPMTFRLSCLDFGPVVLATLPNEPFTEIGLELRKGIFAGKLAFAISHGNGTGSATNFGGYIPNPWNYGRGGYETTPRSNPLEKMTGEKLLAAWRELARQ